MSIKSKSKQRQNSDQYRKGYNQTFGPKCPNCPKNGDCRKNDEQNRVKSDDTELVAYGTTRGNRPLDMFSDMYSVSV